MGWNEIMDVLGFPLGIMLILLGIWSILSKDSLFWTFLLFIFGILNVYLYFPKKKGAKK